MKKLALLSSAACLILVNAASAQQQISKDKLADLVNKVGGEATKQYLGTSDFKVAKSTLPPEKQNAFLEAKLADYANMMGVFYRAKNAGEWTGIGVRAIFGIAGARGGAGSIPATLFDATIGAYIDAGNEAIGKIAERRARQFFAANMDQILAESGVSSYAALQADPSKLRIPIALANDLQRRAKVTGDKSLEEGAQAILAEVATTTNEAILNSLKSGGEKLDSITKDLGDLIEAVDRNHDEVMEKLDRHESALNAVGEKVEDLSKRMASIDAKVSTQGRNQSFIADFVLREMDPRQKSEALKAGFMAERFACAPDQPSCNSAELKQELIEGFEAQADLEDNIKAAAGIVSGLNNVSRIASDLGIESPELQQAAAIGNAAIGAVTAWFSGDPLSAISAVTSLFGKKKDPNAAMMAYLKKQFEQVNAKLDAILKNQQILLESIVKLSEQLQRSVEALDMRLARLEFESTRMSEGVRALLWEPWKPCYSVYATAIDKNSDGTSKYLIPGTYRFKSFQDAYNVFALRDGFVGCLEKIQSDMDSLSATRWFGNFIDAQWVLDEGLLQDAPTNPEKGEWRSRLQIYQQDIFGRSRYYAGRYLEKSGMSPSTVLSLMATTVPEANSMRAEIAARQTAPFECRKTNSPRDERFYQLLCNDAATSADEKASALLSRAIIAEMTIEVANWLSVISQIADIYKGQGQVHKSLDELISSSDTVQRGRELVSKSGIVLDLAVASYAQTYGGIPALGIMDALDDAAAAPADESGNASREEALKAIAALNGQNSYLTANFAMLLLKREYERKWVSGNQVDILPETSYRNSYEAMERKRPEGIFLLKALFGDHLNFGLADDGSPTLVVSAGDQSTSIKLPAPDEFSKGRLVYPPRFYRLLAKREEMASRLADYDIVGGTEQPGEYASVLMNP